MTIFFTNLIIEETILYTCNIWDTDSNFHTWAWFRNLAMSPKNLIKKQKPLTFIWLLLLWSCPSHNNLIRVKNPEHQASQVSSVMCLNEVTSAKAITAFRSPWRVYACHMHYHWGKYWWKQISNIFLDCWILFKVQKISTLHIVWICSAPWTLAFDIQGWRRGGNPRLTSSLEKVKKLHMHLHLWQFGASVDGVRNKDSGGWL